MSGPYLIGLDIGGSGGRCLVIDTDTGAVTASSRRWTHTRAPQHGFWALTLNTGRVWQVAGETCREALARAGADPEAVAALAVTSVRHGLVVIDRAGTPRFAVPTMDTRAGMLAVQLSAERGPEIYRRTGRWPNPILGAVRLMWLAQSMPAVLEEAQAALSPSDWLGYRLTGAIAAARTQAAETAALDLATGEWAADLLATYDLPRALLPPLVDAGTPIGTLAEAAAAHLGLPRGTPVVAAGGDTQCAALAAGAAATGDLAVVAGTTTSVMRVARAPQLDPAAHLWTGPHIVPGLYVLESNVGATGEILDWLAAALYAEHPTPVAAFCAEAAHAAPAAAGITSTVGAHLFHAPSLDLPVDGLAFSPISMMRAGANRPELARAILEGMAYAVRANIEQIEAVTGQPAPVVRLAGGLTRSATWSTILAGVLDRPVHVAAPPDASAHGAAICAGVGAGLYPNLAAGAAALGAQARSHTPGPNAAVTYRAQYTSWTAQREARAEGDARIGEAIIQEILALPDPEPVATGQDAADAGPFCPRIYVSADLDEASLAALRALGEVTYANYREVSRLLVGEELWETLQGVHVFVTEVDVVDAEALQKLPDLRLIVVCRGNPVNIDLAACTAAGVPVVHAPGRNADAVADLTLAFMVMLARRLPAATTFLHAPGGEPGDMGRMGMAHEQFQGVELWHKTVGLVGAGAVGRQVIRRLLPFGAHVLVADPYITQEDAALLGAEKVDLPALLARSDFVSLHAPVTAETRGMIDAGALAQMKDGAFLINTARAALVDEAALVRALTDGKLAGAALDVFAVEPPGATDPLLACPNLIATPHIGGNTRDVASHQGALVAAALEQLLTGEEPANVVNPETLAAFDWTGPRHETTQTLEHLAAGPGPAVTDLEVAARSDAGARPPSTGEDAGTRPGRPPTGPVAADTVVSTRPQTVDPPPPRPALTDPPYGTAGRGWLRRLTHRLLGRPSNGSPSAPHTGQETAGAPATAPTDSEVVAKLERILARFTTDVAASPEMAAFARGKDVTMGFTLRDTGQEFYLSFVDGQVAAGLGPAPRPTNVQLKMNAAILDGVFTGKVNGMRAAMTGKLSFSGDTNKAMAFQRLQGDLGERYQAARAAVGDPGDLTQIGAPLVQVPAAGAAPGGNGAHPPGPTPVAADDVRAEVIAVMNDLYTAHLITPTGGNISVRTDADPDHAWITPSAVFKGDLRAEMLVRIDLNGRVVSDTGYSASSERHVHCAIYRQRPEIRAVVHAHAPQATLMALAGIAFAPISPEAAFLGEIAVVPFIKPGSTDLADAVAAALGAQGSAVLMQNHGLVVAGSSLRRAADVTYIVEDTAEKLVACRLLGVTPPTLPDAAVAEYRAVGKMIA